MYKAIMANIDKIAIMDIMTWLYRVMNRTNIGVYAKNRRNLLTFVNILPRSTSIQLNTIHIKSIGVEIALIPISPATHLKK